MRADMPPLTGDSLLCNIRIARYCARLDRPANAHEKPHSAYSAHAAHDAPVEKKQG